MFVPLRRRLEPHRLAQLIHGVPQLRQRLQDVRQQARLELRALRRLARVGREERRTDPLERLEERDELLRGALAVLDAAEPAREVGEAPEELAELRELGGLVGEDLLDGFGALAEGAEGETASQPLW